MPDQQCQSTEGMKHKFQVKYTQKRKRKGKKRWLKFRKLGQKVVEIKNTRKQEKKSEREGKR